MLRLVTRQRNMETIHSQKQAKSEEVWKNTVLVLGLARGKKKKKKKSALEVEDLGISKEIAIDSVSFAAKS